MDNALKQRLVGATVLIALAVIVLPMLLGGRPESDGTEPEVIEIPEEPAELSFETRRYPIGEKRPDDDGRAREPDSKPVERELPTPRREITETPAPVEDPVAGDTDTPDGLEVTALGPAPGETPVTDPVETDASTENTETEAQPESAEPEVADEDPAPEPPTPPAPAAGRYVVQVASFGAAENATRLSDRLVESGYNVMTDTVTSDVGTLHRVRVGPFETESMAREQAGALEESLDGVTPRVMDLRPDQSAQVTTPEDPLVRWVVQVGSFSNSANAENVVAKLRLQGMSAYQETIQSGDTEIFRVRVGPFLDREDALSAEQTVNTSLSVTSVVMSIR